MKKTALFLVLIGVSFNGNIVAMDNCGAYEHGLTSFGKKIIEGIGQDRSLFAGSMATFSAGAAALSWLKNKFYASEIKVKDMAKRGACVGAGLATAASLMRTVNTYPEMFNNAVKNNQNIMCGVVAGSALAYGIGSYFAPKNKSSFAIKVIKGEYKLVKQKNKKAKIISTGAAALTAGILYGVKNGEIAEVIGKNILEHKYLTGSLLAAGGGVAYLYKKLRDDFSNNLPDRRATNCEIPKAFMKIVAGAETRRR